MSFFQDWLRNMETNNRGQTAFLRRQQFLFPDPYFPQQLLHLRFQLAALRQQFADRFQLRRLQKLYQLAQLQHYR